MKRLVIVCEGPTENEFCNDVLLPALLKFGICVEAPLIKRSQGGIVSWHSVRQQILMHLHENETYVTLLIDYYGIKDSHAFPGWEDGKKIADKTSRMRFLFGRMAADIPEEIRNRFIPYMQLHEFESLLFSDINVISQSFDKDEADIARLQRAVDEFDTPEDINSRRDLAPSKRLMSAIPSYDKVVFGSCLAHDIGLEKILSMCPLFREWYGQITSI